MLVTYLIPFLIVLTVLVFFHELGHFWVARRCGVKVDVFSIGFGPELFGWTDRLGTRWRFSIIPFGGYVKMLGDADVTSRPNQESMESLPKELKTQTLHSKPVWQRMTVSFAGPLANFIVAFLIMAPIFFFKGEPSFLPKIDSVLSNSVAEKIGLQKGDLITSINGYPIPSIVDLRSILRQEESKPLTLKVKNEKGKDRTIKASVSNMKDPTTGKSVTSLGFKPSFEYTYRPCTLTESLYKPICAIISFCQTTAVGIGHMIMGKRSSKELGGIISIGHMAGKSFETGIVVFFLFMAMLSLNLGFINLLPIPGLDGGHILIYLIEIVTRKPLSAKIQEILFMVGFTLVGGLMLLSTWNDIVHFLLKRF